MWMAVSIVLFGAGLALHLWWARRADGLVRKLSRLEKEAALAKAKQAHAAAQARTHQLALFNSMVEGILILDASGRVQTVNKSLERLFSLKQEVEDQTLLERRRAHEISGLYGHVQKEGVVRAFGCALPAIQHTRYLGASPAAIRTREDLSDGANLRPRGFGGIQER